MYCRDLPQNVTKEQFVKMLPQALGFIYQIEYNVTDLEFLDVIVQKNKMASGNVMDAIVQPCDDFLLKCRWMGTLIDCSSIFVKTYTYFGTCCTLRIEHRYSRKFASNFLFNIISWQRLENYSNFSGRIFFSIYSSHSNFSYQIGYVYTWYIIWRKFKVR